MLWRSASKRSQHRSSSSSLPLHRRSSSSAVRMTPGEPGGITCGGSRVRDRIALAIAAIPFRSCSVPKQEVRCSGTTRNLARFFCARRIVPRDLETTSIPQYVPRHGKRTHAPAERRLFTPEGCCMTQLLAFPTLRNPNSGRNTNSQKRSPVDHPQACTVLASPGGIQNRRSIIKTPRENVPRT